MNDMGLILLCYGIGLVLVIAEVFVPSHGLLTIGALACFAIAVVHTFAQSTTAGVVGTVCCLVFIPSVLLLGMKYVQYLPMADRLAPPTILRSESASSDSEGDIRQLVGRIGVADTPLHPVGMCEFDGVRIACVAESGMIDQGARVVGVAVRMQNLAVRPLAEETHDATNNIQA